VFRHLTGMTTNGPLAELVSLPQPRHVNWDKVLGLVVVLVVAVLGWLAEGFAVYCLLR
jgi:hypothetical protein